MKVMIVYSTRYPHVRGGVDSMIVSLVDELKANNEVVLFAAGEPHETTPTFQVVDGIKTHVLYIMLPMYSRFSLGQFLKWLCFLPATMLKIRRILKDEKVEVLHLHMLHRYYLPFVFLRLLGGPPYVSTLHRAEIVGYQHQPAFVKAISRFILRNASRIVAVSHSIGREANAAFPFVAPVGVVPNGIPLPILVDEPKEVIEETIGRPLPEAYFTIIGTLEHYKAHDVAIEAWVRVTETIPDAHLILVGDGSLKDHYTDMIRQRKLQDRVHIVGRMSRSVALSLARRAVAVIIPSRTEGLPYILLEAGGLGLPVVCSDIGPLVEVVEDGVSARVVPVDDHEALANAVTTLFGSPDDRATLSRNIKATIESTYTSDLMARAYEEEFGRALARSR